MVILYCTEKTAAGFLFQVYTVEHGKESRILRDGILPTRAKALARGKYWAKFHTQANQNFANRYNLEVSAT